MRCDTVIYIIWTFTLFYAINIIRLRVNYNYFCQSNLSMQCNPQCFFILLTNAMHLSTTPAIIKLNYACSMKPVELFRIKLKTGPKSIGRNHWQPITLFTLWPIQPVPTKFNTNPLFPLTPANSKSTLLKCAVNRSTELLRTKLSLPVQCTRPSATYLNSAFRHSRWITAKQRILHSLCLKM